MVCGVSLAGVGTAQADGYHGENRHRDEGQTVVYHIEYNCYVGESVNTTTPSEGTAGVFAVAAETASAAASAVGFVEPQGVNSNANICSPGTSTNFVEKNGD